MRLQVKMFGFMVVGLVGTLSIVALIVEVVYVGVTMLWRQSLEPLNNNIWLLVGTLFVIIASIGVLFVAFLVENYSKS